MDWAGYTKFVSFPLRRIFFFGSRAAAQPNNGTKNPEDAAPEENY